MRKFFRTILLAINIIFALALILSTLAGTLPPSKWAAISILSYGYVALVLANIIFIIVWLCLSRWEFLVSVIAIALRFSFVGLFFQIGGTNDSTTDENSLKVMTFNTHGFKGLDSDTLMTADSGAMLFLEIVDEEQPDVLCLQEFQPLHKSKLVDSLAARGYRNRFGVHGESVNSAAILFTRCKLVKGHEIDKKSKFYVDIEKNGHNIRVCVVHLDSYQLSEDDMKGLENLAHAQPDSSTHNMLRKFKETTCQHEQEWTNELLPIIEKTESNLVIAGDFNDTPASYIYSQITKHLTDPYVEQGCGFGSTYHGPYPAFRIDYIFHSPTMATKSYKRVKTNISDHYPVVVTMELAN